MPTSSTPPPSSRPPEMDLESSLLFLRELFTASPPSETTLKTLRRLCSSSNTKVRGACLRKCRILVERYSGVDALNRLRFHLLTCRSLEREPRFLDERVQALKLIRAMGRASPERLPRTLVRSMVSIATHRDDQLKEAALETLREYALLNTRAVAECGGISALVNAVMDPTVVNMADSILLTLLHLLNEKETRMWMRATMDLAVILAPFTSGDAVGGSPGPEGEEERRIKRRLSRKAIVTMMRTWTGLFILASDPHGLRSLVQTLVQPVSFELRKDVLDTILEVFNTVNPLRASPLHGSTVNFQQDLDVGGGANASGNNTIDGSNPTTDLTAAAITTAPTSSPISAPPTDHVKVYGSEPYMAEYWGVGPGSAGSKELAAGGFHAERVPGRHTHTHTLLDNYLVMVLSAFVECGLVEALVELSVSAAPPMSRTATQLLSFVSRFSTRLLPGSVSRRLLSQKKLVSSAVDAARAGKVLDRARAQRAAHVVGLLSRIVGSGYDTALATLLSRSCYEDGVALASEIALVGSAERAHLNLGVFPRSVIVSVPTIQELLAPAMQLGVGQLQQMQMRQQQQQQQQHTVQLQLQTRDLRADSATLASPGGATTPGRSNSVSLVSKLKKISRRLTASSSKSMDLAPNSFEITSELLGDEGQTSLAAPLVANRGHRRLVQQLVMTDMAQIKRSAGGVSEDLKKLMDKARIMLKIERRAWANWDWVAIEETLSGPCQTPHVCAEVLKTKFFKRLSAFYVVASNGPFAQLAWEPDNVAYTNVATSMLRLLLDLPDARDFLFDDRRGRIAAQIVEALQKELNHAEDAESFERGGYSLNMPPPTPGSTGGGGGSPQNSRPSSAGIPAAANVHHETVPPRSSNSGAFRFFKHSTAAQHAGGPGGGGGNNAGDDDEDEDDFDQTGGNRVFTAQACSTTMTREFFVLLGVFASHKDFVKKLSHELQVFNILNRLAVHREKDYILRLVVSHLDYSGATTAIEAREWLTHVLTNIKVSPDLRHFAIGFFRSMLRSAQNQIRVVANWILGLIFAQLKYPEVFDDALSVLIEASHYQLYLEIMVEMIEVAVRGGKNDLAAHLDLLQRPIAKPLILKFLGTEGGVRALKTTGFLSKVMDEWREKEFAQYLRKIDSALLYQLVGKRPAPDGVGKKTICTPVPIPVRAHEASALSEPGFTASELQWLFRMPWRIEVWAESSIGTMRVPMDAFIDCSRLRPESLLFSGNDLQSKDDDESALRGICVTAVPPWSRDKDADKRQRARPFIVPEDATVYACLALANQAVDRKGRTNPSPRAGGGYPYSKGAHIDAASGWTENIPSRFRSFSTQSVKRSTSAAVAGVGGVGPRPVAMSRRSEQSDELDFDEDPFAEAGGAGGHGGDDFVRPLSDEKFWVKCTPTARKVGVKNSNGGSGGFLICPQAGASTFRFASLDSQHRESIAGLEERDAPTDGTFVKSNEPEVRHVNPLLTLKGKKSAVMAAAGPKSSISEDKSDLPPLLVLKEVRFYLDLVPQRFASPSIPVHLLGELAKTQLGVGEMDNAGFVDSFCKRVKDHGLTSTERRAAIWAIGHIGASPCGFDCLTSTDSSVVRNIHLIAVDSTCLTLRGAACYALGLFSRHRAGCAALHSLGWATLDPRTHPYATIAVPAKIGRSPFQFPNGRYTTVDVATTFQTPVEGVLPLGSMVSGKILVSNPDAQRVLNCVSDLSNHIAQKEAHAQLTKIKEANPQLFTDVKLFLGVHDLLARFNYELPVRQYVLGLFHARINFDNDKAWQIVDATGYR